MDLSTIEKYIENVKNANKSHRVTIIGSQEAIDEITAYVNLHNTEVLVGDNMTGDVVYIIPENKEVPMIRRYTISEFFEDLYDE